MPELGSLGSVTMHRTLIWLSGAVVILVTALLLTLVLWVYPPASDDASRRIAADLFKYRSQFANQGYLSIGLTPVLPDSLWKLCPRGHDPSCHTDMNSARLVYSDTRFGIYCERWFELKRSSSNDTVWTFTRAGRTMLPMKGWVYFNQSITVTNSP